MRWMDRCRKQWRRLVERMTGTVAEAGAWDPKRTLRGLAWLAAGGAVLGLVLCWGRIERRLGQYVVEHRGAGAGQRGEQVVLVDAPGWMPTALRRQMQVIVAGQLGADVLDKAGLDRAYAALGQSPWVERVERLERVPGRVLVMAVYRRPVAGVETTGGYRLVDAKGVALPGWYQREHLGQLGLPAIIGVGAASPGDGQRWASADLAAGLTLVRYLWRQPYMRQIVAFDVGGKPFGDRGRDAAGRVRLALWTRDGLVRWGLAPGQERAIEPAAATKAAWLAAVAQRHQSIDAGGRTVDVFGSAVLVHDAPDDRGAERRYTLGR